MNMTEHYVQNEPSRTEVDAMQGALLLEFGTAWCGHCRAAQPLLAKALAERSGMRETVREPPAAQRSSRREGMLASIARRGVA